MPAGWCTMAPLHGQQSGKYNHYTCTHQDFPVIGGEAVQGIEAIHHGPAEQPASAPRSLFQLVVSLSWPSTFFRFCWLAGLAAVRSGSRLFPEEAGSDTACAHHLFSSKQQGNVRLMNRTEG